MGRQARRSAETTRGRADHRPAPLYGSVDQTPIDWVSLVSGVDWMAISVTPFFRW
jgi:hypothetical protein